MRSTENPPKSLVRGIRASIHTEQSSQKLDGVVVACRDGPLLVGLSGRPNVLGVATAENDLGSDGGSSVDLETVVVLLNSLDGNGIDAFGGQGSDRGEEGDGRDHFVIMRCY